MDWQAANIRNRIQLLALFILGAILAGVAELPLGGWLQIPILSVIWWQLNKLIRQPIKTYFTASMFFGLGYFMFGLWWIYISLHDIGGMHWMLSAAAVFLLSSGMALFFSAASLSIWAFKDSRAPGILLAASWVLIEWLRCWLFTGFPWMGLAESQVNGPFGPVAPYLGGLACTFLAVWGSWQIYIFKRHPRVSGASLICVLLLMPTLSLWHFTKPQGTPLTVELIQGNFSQSLIFNPNGIFKQIQFYDQAMKSSHAD